MTKILAVDNEKDSLQMIKKILEKAGYKVITASTGREGLKKKKTEKPQIVLLDLMMPDLSGWDVFQRIRKENHGVKIAFISVLDVSDQRKKILLKEGLSDYITKPFTESELVKRVNAIALP